jgi:hypothetical protein
MAKRVGVIHDCAAFEGVLLSKISLAQAKTIDRSAATGRATNLSADADTEHVFDVRMQQIIIQQLVRQAGRRGTCLERVMTGVMVYSACLFHGTLISHTLPNGKHIPRGKYSSI